MEFSEKLKKLREEKGVSQQKLADDIYVSRSAVAKWENGLGMPCLESQKLLCDYFGIETTDLVSDSDTIAVKKNKIIHKYKIYIIFLIALTICSIAVGIYINHRVKRKETHIIYDKIPYLKVDEVETNYYQIGYAYEKDGDEFIFKNNVLVIPSASELANITTLDKKDSMRLEFGFSCYCDVMYYYVDDEYETIDDKGGWSFARLYEIEHIDEKNNTIYLDDVDFNNNVVLIISCDYPDLNVKYYYVINK